MSTNDFYWINTFGRTISGGDIKQNYPNYPICARCGKPYIYICDVMGDISQYVCTCTGMTQPMPIPNYNPPQELLGWICPRCKKVNAPFVTECDCKE